MEKIFKNLVIASAVAWVTYIIFITLYPNSLLSEELAAIQNANLDKLDDMFGLFMILMIRLMVVSMLHKWALFPQFQNSYRQEDFSLWNKEYLPYYFF